MSGSRQPSVLSRPPSISRVTVVPGAEHPSVNTEHQDEAGWSVFEVVGGGIVVEWLCAILKRAYNKKTTNKQKAAHLHLAVNNATSSRGCNTSWCAAGMLQIGWSRNRGVERRVNCFGPPSALGGRLLAAYNCRSCYIIHFIYVSFLLL